MVVPFRNEAAYLPFLLLDLLRQNYPKDRYRIVLVDDHSDDGGIDLGGYAGATQDRVELLSLVDYPPARATVAHKKAALEYAIGRSRAELIVTTDADCRWPAGGLRNLVKHFNEGAEVVLGPVFINHIFNLCDVLQALDLAGYQLYTAACVRAGRPTLANGAHLAFRRDAFEAVGGYAGVDHLPSGDDVLLLHKFVAAGKRVAYADDPDGVVTTFPVSGWWGFWRQRLRWAGKAGDYTSTELKFGQALTYLLCLGILLGLVIAPELALSAWLAKALVDFVLLYSVCRHYGRGGFMWWYPLVQLVYPFYIVGVGTAALLGFTVAWKGRE